MTLGRQVDDAIHLLLLHEGEESVKVADVHLHELIVGHVLDVPQVLQVAGVGQFVEVDDVVLRVLAYKEPYHMASYEACSSCNHDGFHVVRVLGVRDLGWEREGSAENR